MPAYLSAYNCLRKLPIEETLDSIFESRAYAAWSPLRDSCFRSKIADVGSYYRHATGLDCSFCHMLSDSRLILNGFADSGVDELYAVGLLQHLRDVNRSFFDNTNPSRGDRLSIPALASHKTLYLLLVDSRSDLSNRLIGLEDPAGRAMMTRGLEKGFLVVRRDGHREPSVFAARRVSPQFEASQAAKWMETCRSHHDPVCYLDSNITEGLRLIDCQSRQVVPAPKMTEYTALSYVWGEVASESILATERSTSMAELPRVIEDAITFTKAMGLRYLWVDRYCIEQDSSVKHEQIRQMDSIYENAQLTIIAAAGQDPGYGLPGISRPRCIQQTAKIGRYTLISTMRHPSLEISATKWSTRAWTYQEAVLSRRRLVFTDTQVYFECKTMSCHESLSGWMGLSNTIGDEQLQSLSPPGLFESSSRTSLALDPDAGLSAARFFHFLGRVEQYTSRQLTYESDSLNAFAGVMRKLAGPQEYLDQIGGIPFYLWDNLTESLFTHGLTWYHPHAMDDNSMFPIVSPRRPAFPSWSWAGWAGRVAYPNLWPGSHEVMEGQVVKVVLMKQDGTREYLHAHFFEREEGSEVTTFPPPFIEIKAPRLPSWAITWDTSCSPPQLMILGRRTQIHLSVEHPTEVDSLSWYASKCLFYVGAGFTGQVILVFELSGEMMSRAIWTRVGLILVNAIRNDFLRRWATGTTATRVRRTTPQTSEWQSTVQAYTYEALIG